MSRKQTPGRKRWPSLLLLTLLVLIPVGYIAYYPASLAWRGYATRRQLQQQEHFYNSVIRAIRKQPAFSTSERRFYSVSPEMDFTTFKHTDTAGMSFEMVECIVDNANTVYALNANGAFLVWFKGHEPFALLHCDPDAAYEQVKSYIGPNSAIKVKPHWWLVLNSH